MASDENYKCVFSNDSDFYSYDDDLFLITINKKIIKQASDEGKIYQ